MPRGVFEQRNGAIDREVIKRRRVGEPSAQKLAVPAAKVNPLEVLHARELGRRGQAVEGGAEVDPAQSAEGMLRVGLEKGGKCCAHAVMEG